MNDWLFANLKSHREPNAVAERMFADRYEVPFGQSLVPLHILIKLK